MAKDNVHKNHRQRMRDKFDEIGFKGWSDYEILEYMLYNVYRQGDTNPIAHNILDYGAGSIVTVMRNTSDFTMAEEVRNVGESAVRFLRSLDEFVKYYKHQELHYMPMQLNKDNIFDIINVVGFCHDKESILMVCTDACLNVKSVTDITSESGTDYATTSIDRIVKTATANNAYCVAIIHNHPNGSIDVSNEDIDLTRNVDNILDSMNINLIDHIIWSRKGVKSIKKHMYLNEKKQGMPLYDKEMLEK